MKNLKVASCLIAAAAVLIPSANAFFGLGGCPTHYPTGLGAPYGNGGLVTNGLYYTYYFD